MMRPFHAGNPDGIEVGIQHEGAASTRTRRAPDNIGPATTEILYLDLENGALEPLRDE